MDKAWVWLPRNCVEYQQGATKFVSNSARRLGNVSYMFCPCLDCRNVVHQSKETVFDHLVIRGMDDNYKRNNCWIKHGDIKNASCRPDVHTSENEAYDLIRTAFIESEGKQSSQNQNAEEFDDIYIEEEAEFRQKLEDAETPLYPNCLSYTKVSAIMGLYRIKIKSGMSEIFFDQLLTLVHDMLPEDNVLPKSTDEIKAGAYIWRPTAEIPYMADALNETIAWPIDRFKLQVQSEESSRKSPMEESTRMSVEKSGSPSTGNSGKGGKPKCVLKDIGDSGQTIAVGRVFSTDPDATVHCIPIGPNASKVLIEIPKVNNARVWGESPEVLTVADASGTFVAWPSDKVIML